MRLSSISGASSAMGMLLCVVHHPQLTMGLETLSTQDWNTFPQANTRELGISLNGKQPDVDHHHQQPMVFRRRRRRRETEHARNDDFYGNDGEHPAEGDPDEIDCSKFTDLDEIPAVCQTHQEEEEEEEQEKQQQQQQQGSFPVGSAGGSQEHGEAGTAMGDLPIETFEPSSIDNTIRVELSVGIHLLDEITQQRYEQLLWLIIQAASVLLDRYSPFDVYAPSTGEDFMYMESHSERERQGGGDSRSEESIFAGTYEDNGDQLLAILHYSSVATWGPPDWEAWLEVSIEYVAFWPNGNPVDDPISLDQIDDASHRVINMTVDGLKFWNELLKEDEDGQFVLKNGCSLQGLDSPTIVAVAKIGDEFELDSMGYAKTEGDTDSSDSETYSRGRDVPFEPLTIEWGVREWFGLGLCVSTLTLATILTVVAAITQRREATNRVWGLTEQGVGELLKVGWAYHQERNGQLFLNIFDKGRLGYTDDTSVLRGEVFAPRIAEVATTSAATTASPASLEQWQSNPER